jgi:ribosomal protein L11 methylase PrmA
VSGKKYTLSTFALKSLLESLRSTVAGLSWQGGATEWADYYESTNYSALSFTKKAEIVDSFLEKAKPREVWDLGSNNGYFSRIATKRGIRALAFDIDPSAVEENYRTVRAQNETLLLPLLLDLTNPSPALGWHERERESFAARGPADMVFALALIHHLSISNNMPFESVAAFFKDIGRKLVIEFVPKSDSQVQKLLSSREDIFTEYDQSRFEAAFSRLFAIDETRPVSGTERTLYLMSRK